MIIKQIEIYGYGKISKESLSLSQGMNVIYGKNEAGKTTWMEFLRHVLFGFPMRTTNERRFEPKQGGVCGGRVVLETKEYGEVTVERTLTGQKATGSLKITNEHGQILPDNCLEEMLGGMSENTFQNIYHFGLEGVQGLHQKKGEELSRYLFSTSMFGQAAPDEILTRLEKDLKGLLRVKGKSAIQDQLQVLEEKEQKLIEWQNMNDSYGLDVMKHNEVTEQISIQKEAIRNCEEGLSRLTRIESVTQFVEAKSLLTRQLQELEISEALTEEKIKEFQTGYLALQREEERLQEIERNCELLEAEITGASSQLLLNKYGSQVKRDFTVAESLNARAELLKVEIHDGKRSIEESLDELGNGITLEEIRELPDSFYDRGELTNLVNQYQKKQSEHERCKVEYINAKDAASNQEKIVADLEQSLLHPQDKKLFEEQIYAFEQAEEIKKNIRSIEAELSYLSTEGQGRKGAKQSKGLTFGMMGILLLGIGYATFTSQWILAIVFTILCGLLIVSTKKSSKDKGTNYYGERKQSLEKELSEYKRHQLNGEMSLEAYLSAKEKLTKDVNIATEQSNEKKLLAHYENELGNARKRLEEASKDCQYYQEAVVQYFAKLGIYSLPPMVYRVEFLEQCFHVKKESKRLQLNQQEFEKCLKELRQIVNFAGGILGMNNRNGEDFYIVREKFEEAAERENTARVYLMEKANRYLSQKRVQQTASEMIGEIKKSLALLLETVGLTSYEELNLQANEFERYKLLREQFNQNEIVLTEKLAQYKLELEECSLERNFDLEMKEWKEDKLRLETTLSELQEQQAVLKVKLVDILNQSKSSELLHQASMEETKIKDFIHSWTIKASAKEMLSRVIKIYKEEKLPKMLLLAEQYFTTLTAGNYHKISISEQDLFIVQNTNGLWFEVKELSRGTCEQLYVALRLALANSQSEDNRMPIILDDPFVNFDDERLKVIIQMLKVCSKNQQVLYFTCHKRQESEFLNDCFVNALQGV